MKFNILKKIPPYAARTPEWQVLPEINLWSKEVLALLSLIPGAIVAFLFTLTPSQINPLNCDITAIVAATIAALPLHEAMHAIATPGFGFSKNTRFGFDTSVGPFCVYLGAVSRRRHQLVLLAPFFTLTVVPLTAAFFGFESEFWCVIASINASLATLDLYLPWWFGQRVPANALLALDENQAIVLLPENTA